MANKGLLAMHVVVGSANNMLGPTQCTLQKSNSPSHRLEK